MAPAEATQLLFRLTGVQLEGSTVFSEADFQDIYAEYIGKIISAADVYAIRNKITAHYSNKGYALSKAIIPPQSLEKSGSIVRIQVIEGYIDKIIWPEGLERYRDFFSRYAEKITGERPLKASTLERYLLLANDLPGLEFRSNLQASETNPGASTLIITMERKWYEVGASVDNRGTEASGPYQGTVSGSVSNLLGLHERVNAAFTLAGPADDNRTQELQYLAFGYAQVLTSEGLTFSFNGNASWGEPGTQTLAALDFITESFNWTAALSYPILRTRPGNLTGTLAFDYKNSESEFLNAPSTEDRLRIVRAELAYDRRDRWKGTNQVIVSVSKGIEGLGSTLNTNTLASRIPGKVDFWKATVHLSRTQSLPHSFSLHGAFFGQYTDDPLLSSQECGYGGAQFGRGYDSSVVTGDQCVLLLGELRYDIPIGGDPLLSRILTALQAYGFVDHGTIWNIDAPLGTPNRADASSFGGGLRFGNEHFNADVQLARTLNRPNVTLSAQEETRVFFRLSAHR